MFWFHEFNFQSVAYLIGFFFFLNPGIKMVLHWRVDDVHIFNTVPNKKHFPD